MYVKTRKPFRMTSLFFKCLPLLYLLLITLVVCESLEHWNHGDLPREISDEESMESAGAERLHRKMTRDEVDFNEPNNASLYLGEAFERLQEATSLQSETTAKYDQQTNSKNQTSNNTTAEWDGKSVPAKGSSRSGRELDLEALLSGHSKQHEPGERESRILNDSPSGIGIQGFIPVLSLGAAAVSAGSGSAASSLIEQSFKKHTSHVPHYGHQATRGHGGSIGNRLQAFASSLSSVGKLKRKQTFDYAQFTQQCACVPFYMCKGGYMEQGSQFSAPVMRMHEPSNQMMHGANMGPGVPNTYLQEAQSELQQLYPPSQWTQLLAQAEQLQQRNPSEQSTYAGTNGHNLYGQAATSDAIAAAAASMMQSQESQRHSISSNANLNNNNQEQSDLELPIDERSVDGSENTHFANSPSINQTEMEVLGRMLGFGGHSGKAHSCGVLRTCCPLLSSSDLLAAHQALEAAVPPQNHLTNYHHKNPTSPGVNPDHMHGGGSLMHQGFHQHTSGHLDAQWMQGHTPAKVPQYIQPVTPNMFQSPLQMIRPPLSQYGPALSAKHMREINVQSLYNMGDSSVLSPVATQDLRSATRNLAKYTAYQDMMAAGAQPLQQIQGRCGLKPDVGGQGRVQNLQYPNGATEFGEFPWQAALLKRLGTADSLFVCGATFLSEQWAATAAHCIKKNVASDLKIRLGEWDVHREDEFYPHVERNVLEVIKHPQFYPGTLANDIALLRLEPPSPVEMQKPQPHIQPVCLPYTGENFAGQRCWVAGWGKDAFGQRGDYQSVLRKVDVPIIGHSQCNARLRNTRLGPGFDLHAGFMCAGGEPGKDACEGDGGSALVCEVNGVWKAAGLVSWGLGCGKAGMPGVYVNMAYYNNWIERVMTSYGSRSEAASAHLHAHQLPPQHYQQQLQLQQQQQFMQQQLLQLQQQHQLQRQTIPTIEQYQPPFQPSQPGLPMDNTAKGSYLDERSPFQSVEPASIINERSNSGVNGTSEFPDELVLPESISHQLMLEQSGSTNSTKSTK